MSEELVGVIITSVVTSIISIIGFVVTYKSMKRNFKEELEKEKTSIHIEKMSSIPYEILELMDSIINSRGKGNYLKDFVSLMDTIYAYGSENAIKIAATMQKEIYTLSNNFIYNKYRVMSMYILLATPIKCDVTGIRVSPEFWFQMKITDYENNKSEFKKANNDIVEELNLEKSFYII